MAVDSYLEMFTSIFGWMFYGVLWDVLTSTGLVYLPFLGMVIDHWRDSVVNGSQSFAGQSSIRGIELNLFSALFIVVIAGEPVGLTPLRANELSYTPPPTLSNPTPSPVTIASNDSTFGSHGFQDPAAEVYVPVWWYAVMAVSGGISHATIEGLPKSHELRQTVNLARMANLDPPSLKSEVAQFYNDCYVPSRSKYLIQRPDNAATQRIFDNQGLQDVDWIGSHTYRELSGFYDSHRATTPITGWSFNPARDTEYEGAGPSFGRPGCQEWWEHPTRGIRRKIVDSVDDSAGGFTRNLVNIGFTFNSEAYLDTAAKAALVNAPDEWTNNAIGRNNLATTGWLGLGERAVKGILTTTGQAIAATLSTLVVSVLVQLLPILQAILLMGIYALLPLYLVFARYSFNALIDGALAVFTIKFWTVLWYLVLWVDQNLIESMYPDRNMLVEVFLGNADHAGKRIMLNIVTTLMYVGLPILWSLMMGWAGSSIGRSLDGASSQYRGIPSDSGRAGLNTLKRFSR